MDEQNLTPDVTLTTHPDEEVVKNEAWEINHNLIAEAMSAYMREHERMPSKTELVKLTGLCRLTIYRHLKEGALKADLLNREAELRVLYTKLLSRMYTYAMNGDVRAAKLYIDTVEKMGE